MLSQRHWPLKGLLLLCVKDEVWVETLDLSIVLLITSTNTYIESIEKQERVYLQTYRDKLACIYYFFVIVFLGGRANHLIALRVERNGLSAFYWLKTLHRYNLPQSREVVSCLNGSCEPGSATTLFGSILSSGSVNPFNKQYQPGVWLKRVNLYPSLREIRASY